MLSQDYFNGVRNRQIKEMLTRFASSGAGYFAPKADAVRISIEDLLVDVSIYKRFMSCYPQYEVCFLAFCDNVTSFPEDSTRDVSSIQTFSYCRKDGSAQRYEIEKKIMGAFMISAMYSSVPDFDKFNAYIANGILVDYVLPGARNSYDDGQLKIVLDVILTLDSSDLTKSNQTLVVGSSHPGPSEGGIAYNVFPLMQLKGDAYLYDSYNDNIEESFPELEMHYYKQDYSYDDVNFDIVLDDAWVEDSYHVDLDPSFRSFQASHFSVKRFPGEEMPYGRSYHQVFKTNGKELRQVSRKIDYNYRDLPIGNCSACRELKFLLKKSYDASVYDFFMKSHKINCITREARNMHVYSKRVPSSSYIEVHPTDISDLDFKCFSWDISMHDKYDKISLDPVKLRNCPIICSSFTMVPYKIFSEASIVLVVGQYKCVHGKVQCCDIKDEDALESWYVSNLSVRFIKFDAKQPVVRVEESDSYTAGKFSSSEKFNNLMTNNFKGKKKVLEVRSKKGKRLKRKKQT